MHEKYKTNFHSSTPHVERFVSSLRSELSRFSSTFTIHRKSGFKSRVLLCTCCFQVIKNYNCKLSAHGCTFYKLNVRWQNNSVFLCCKYNVVTNKMQKEEYNHFTLRVDVMLFQVEISYPNRTNSCLFMCMCVCVCLALCLEKNIHKSQKMILLLEEIVQIARS